MGRRRQLRQPQIKEQIQSDEAYYDQQAPDGWPVRDIPRPLVDVKIGDAAAGESIGRRIHLFGTIIEDSGAELLEFSQQIAIATARTTDTRPRQFHVSFFGNELQRYTQAVNPIGPIPESDIPNLIRANTTQVQGRIQIQDESGGRTIDVDTLGTASIDVYAFAVTVFALVPANFYSVDTTPAAFIAPNNPTRSGVVVDSMFGARIIPIALNGTSFPKVTTRRVRVTNGGASIIAVPPGSRFVEIIAPSAAAAAATTIDFTPTIDPVVFAAAAVPIGGATFIAGETTTRRIMIPNAVGIRIFNGSGAPVNYQLVFETDR
jgi:hypothetical protein